MTIGPNKICRACAAISLLSMVLPWLVLRDWVVHAPPGIILSVTAPISSYPLIAVAASFFGLGTYSLPITISVAALVFIAGSVLSWWSPIGGILQVGSIYSVAVSLVQSDYLLFRGTIMAEYDLGMGFHMGFMTSLATVLSLSPSARSTLTRAFERLIDRIRPHTT